MWVKSLMNVKSIMRDWLSCWLASTNRIRDGWSGCDWWLALANGIRDGWPGCDWWLIWLMTSYMDGRVDYVDWLRLMVSEEMTGLILWLVWVNGIQDG
jgi:hypothetical protein